MWVCASNSSKRPVGGLDAVPPGAQDRVDVQHGCGNPTDGPPRRPYWAACNSATSASASRRRVTRSRARCSCRSEGFRSRLTDFLNAQGDDFLPLTDAEVTWLDGSRAPGAPRRTSRSPARHVVLVVELSPAPAPVRLTASSTSSGRRPDVQPRVAGARRAEARPARAAPRARARGTRAAGSSPSPPRGSPATRGSASGACASAHARRAAAPAAALVGGDRRDRLVQPLVAVAERRLGRDHAQVARVVAQRPGSARRRLADHDSPSFRPGRLNAFDADVSTVPRSGHVSATARTRRRERQRRVDLVGDHRTRRARRPRAASRRSSSRGSTRPRRVVRVAEQQRPRARARTRASMPVDVQREVRPAAAPRRRAAPRAGCRAKYGG